VEGDDLVGLNNSLNIYMAENTIRQVGGGLYINMFELIWDGHTYLMEYNTGTEHLLSDYELSEEACFEIEKIIRNLLTNPK
jgi:hypothetical protein